MKKLTCILFLVLTISSCGSLTKYIEQQKKLNQAVQSKVYNISLSDAKAGVTDYFNGWRSVDTSDNAKRIREELDQGFVYKKQYFQKYEPGLFDLFSALTSSEEKSIQKYFTKNNYHTIEDTKTSFKFIFSGMLFQGTKIGANQVKIEALSFNALERGPYQLDVNWMAFLSKHQNLFSISKGKVLLEDSMKYSKRDDLAEIDLFKKLDPKGYEKVIQ